MTETNQGTVKIPKMTHVQLSVELREELRIRKRGGENYDHLIWRLLARLDAQELTQATP